MLQALAPLLGCGLMLVVCMAAMALMGRRKPAASRDEPGAPDADIAALREEVARLRRIAEDRNLPAGVDDDRKR